MKAGLIDLLDKIKLLSIIMVMKRILEFFKSNKVAIVWTLCYVCVMWGVLFGMFGFDMFSASDWTRLMRAQLHGFAGFVFGILILSALPLYVATMVLVVRTGKPLLTVPVPNAVKNLAKKVVPAKQEDAKSDAESSPSESESLGAAQGAETFPDVMPSELRGAFMRARQRAGYTPISNFDTSKMVQAVSAPAPELMPVGVGGAVATTPASMASEVPLPDDFDFDATDAGFDSDDAFAMEAPMFKDIEFDSDVSVVSKNVAADLEQYLREHNVEFVCADDGLVRARDMVIAVHDDDAFWVADDEAWFATGAQKPSPIAALKNAAVSGLRPVLYLAESNIMDIDALRTAWTDAGILVIDNLDALPL